MSILPAYTIEDRFADHEKATLDELLRALEEHRVPEEGYYRGVVHIGDVFRDAEDLNDLTGRRKRFVKWFGSGADQVIKTLSAFFPRYIETWQQLHRSDRSEYDADELEAKAALQKVREAISTFGEGFAIWPPPRSRICF